MSSHLQAFVLSVILIAGIGAIPAFAQTVDPIIVSTDKTSYSDGETVIISGEVKNKLDIPVSLQVFAANGNLIKIAQLDVDDNNKFSLELLAGGDLWRSSGTYTIKVTYGVTGNQSSETEFEFGGSSGTKTGGDDTTPPGTVRVENTDFFVSYEITGGKILSITPDVDANSLIIAIETTSDGELTITLPRSLIDSTLPDGGDDAFFVLIDGEERDFDEEANDSDRTLTISFEDGTEEIEIIGTFVVPEFGTIAALILAVAIISIIAVSARSRLNILPKY